MTRPAIQKEKISQDETRNLIVEAARDHLRRYGHDKVTVVDIARSLGMSHANVYRFFKNKSELLDAVIDRWLGRVGEFVDSVAARPGSAVERLENVVLELHRRRRTKYFEDPEVYESFRRFINAWPDAAAKRQAHILSVFKEIIEVGMATGEFVIADAEEAATALEDATAIFLHPSIMPRTLNERTEERARNVVRLIVAGMKRAE